MLAERLASQLLSGRPGRDPVDVARRLLAIQAQDPRGARLAVRARSAGLSAADVDRALSSDRSLLITWLNRGTLHLVASEDYPVLQALTAPPHVKPTLRRLAQLGVDAGGADRGVAAVESALAKRGPLTREQLAGPVEAAGVPTAGQRLVHVLALACLRGVAVRGPVIDGRHAYGLVSDWLDAQPRIERDRALAELARRYLAGHAPAAEGDLARWAGLPLRDARAGLRSIAAELRDRDDGLLEPRRRRSAAELPPPKLLGAFEPVLLGWSSREPILGPHAERVVRGGMFRPFALLGGRAAASWRMARGKVELEPFLDIDAVDRAALEEEAADVARFLGVSRGPSRSPRRRA